MDFGVYCRFHMKQIESWLSVGKRMTLFKLLLLLLLFENVKKTINVIFWTHNAEVWLFGRRHLVNVKKPDQCK